MSNELKPCPFCGSNDFDICSNAIECTNCKASICCDAYDEDELIERWNTRVAGEE